MRQMALPRDESGILPLRFFRGYPQLGEARAASKLGVRSVRVVPDG